MPSQAGLVGLFVSILCTLSPLQALSQANTPAKPIIYPYGWDYSSNYSTCFLRHVVDRALAQQTDYQLVASQSDERLQGLTFASLSRDRGPDIVWSMTSKDREGTTIAIRIPVFKGTMGWRVPIVRKGREQLMRDINLSQIRNLRGVQGADWPDLDILRHVNLNMQGVISPYPFQGLFRMIDNGRADYFLRGVIETWDELDYPDNNNLALEQSLVIHYPTASYFFIKHSQLAFAQLLEQALESMVASGEYNNLFNRAFQQRFKDAKLHQRRWMMIDNPLLPKNTPLEREALWASTEEAATNPEYFLSDQPPIECTNTIDRPPGL